MVTVEEVGVKIRAAIRDARDEGYAIKPNNMKKLGRDHLECCVLGAVSRNSDCLPYNVAATRLGLTLGQVVCIAQGFDRRPLIPSYQQWYDLGQQLRREVIEGSL